MNPNQGPIGPQPEFKPESLEKKFSYSFTRKQCFVLAAHLRQVQLQLGQMQTGILLSILDEIERTAIQSVTPDDYVKEERTPVTPPVVPTSVQTN